MREHSGAEDDPAPDEGWVTADRLFDSEITSVTLCRFAGIMIDGGCPARRTERHPDVECGDLFVSIRALRSGTIDMTQISDADVVRIPMGSGGDPSASSYT